MDDTIALLQRLGFCINVEKSVLQPTLNIEYLGNIIDTTDMTIYLSDCRILWSIQVCEKLKGKTRDSIQEVARVKSYWSFSSCLPSCGDG